MREDSETGDTNKHKAISREEIEADQKRLVDTGPLRGDSSSKATQPRPFKPEPEVETDSQPWSIILEAMTEDPQIFGVDVRGLVVVGRSDPNSSEQPDLDLAPYGAFKQGVSRRHAVFMPTRQGLTLLDLDSTNGTWVNGISLGAGQKSRIRTGDIIEFGSLKLRVRLVGAVPTDQGEDSTMITRRRPKNE